MGDINIKLRDALAAFHRGDQETVKRLCMEVLKEQPDQPIALYRLGLAEGQQGQFDHAAGLIRKALACGLDDPEGYLFLGMVLHSIPSYEEAIESYERFLERVPRHLDALTNLSQLEYTFGRVSRAEELCRRAIAIDPAFYKAHMNLALALRDQGRLREALDSYDRVIRLAPNYAGGISSRLLCMCYAPWVDNQTLFEKHCEAGARLTGSSQTMRASTPVENERLRIGFLSPDFRTHSVSYFVEPILEHLDHTKFDVYCYSDVRRPDPLTLRLKAMARVWREIWNVEDHEQLAKMIAQDRIDILVDLTGHSANNRLPVFAHRPAPVQISHIGYPATTGLAAIDYRLTDQWADPPPQDAFHVEKLIRLKPCFLCYKAPHDAPAVATELPSTSSGVITFGSFNNLPKINDTVISVWASILKAVSGSRLMMKTKPLVDENVRRRYVEKFAAEGIEKERLILRSHSASRAEHLACYNEIDIALDPFPYNGTTTTCEALWMGVPVIGLTGKRHSARVTSSILNCIGLSHLVASSPEHYTSLAAFLAQNHDQLRSLRRALRPALCSSPLCDAPTYTRHLERTLLDLWSQRKA